MQQPRRHVPQRAPSCAATRFTSFVSSRAPARVALLVVIALASVVTSMVLNTRMAQTSFEIREQQLVLNELEAQSWTMRAELDRKASPTELEKAAKANGMVPAGKSGFITLETGTVEAGTPAK